MLLKDFIRELQDIYFEEVRASGAEPEIFIDLFRQSDSVGNFEYCGLAADINVQTSGKTRKIVISAIDIDDTQISDFAEMQEEPPKLDVKTEISLLKDYPRVKAIIESTWGTEKGRHYLNGLIIDDRPFRENSKVQGFPKHIYTTLNNLLTLHDETYPKYVPETKLWDINNGA